MSGKIRANGWLLTGAVLTAFGAGYGMRAGSESGWVPAPGERLSAEPSPKIRLIQTAQGQRYVDQMLAQTGDGKTLDSTNGKRTYKPNLKPYESLDEVRRAIRDNFVRTKIDDEQLTHGAIRGMLRSLGDRFTRFLTPEEYKEFSEKNGGEFTGIGARIDLIEEYHGSAVAKPFGASRPYIVEPMAGGPAQKAALLKDDVILSINGKSTAEMSQDAVVQYIRGERGTKVKLQIERKTKAGKLDRDATFKTFDIDITRDIIEVHPVTLEWLPNRIAWIKLDEFNKKSAKEMGEALTKLRTGPKNEDGTPQGPARGLVFDLRDNPGGLLDAAVDIGSRFIAEGPIVYQRERDGSEEALIADRDNYMNLKVPIVILVNNYSASAAEVVTGAMKDKGVATVVGEQSYGKAAVQVLLEMKNGGALIITTAKYFTPAKRDISEKGIAPDFVVKASTEDEKTGRGAQLNKAVAIIQEKNQALAARP
ncbi:MAG TPA: S41 family peptidase [Abditibacteriaceae bacterium]|jgi:carboxyl-terminal processing protease